MQNTYSFWCTLRRHTVFMLLSSPRVVSKFRQSTSRWHICELVIYLSVALTRYQTTQDSFTSLQHYTYYVRKRIRIIYYCFVALSKNLCLKVKKYTLLSELCKSNIDQVYVVCKLSNMCMKKHTLDHLADWKVIDNTPFKYCFALIWITRLIYICVLKQYTN